MKIASVLENQKVEKRIAITPEIAKKYLALGFEVVLSENYGVHLGIKDEEYIEIGAKILKEDNEIILSTDKGGIMRCAVKEIRVAGRNTQGVRIKKLKGEEKVVSVIKIDDNIQ